MNPNSLANLKPLEKGTQRTIEIAKKGGEATGNRKKLKSVIKEIMNMPIEEITRIMGMDTSNIPDGMHEKTVVQAIWIRAHIQAIEGDRDARRDVTQAHALVEQEEEGVTDGAPTFNINPTKVVEDGRTSKEEKADV